MRSSPTVQPGDGLFVTITRRHWPLFVSVAILLLTVYVVGSIAKPRTQGHLVYPLDDTYIHMAMAKNLVRHGVWGVTPDGFTSTSSSPLWTLLLALVYGLVGVNEVAPFIMSLVSACLVLGVAHWILRTLNTPPRIAFLAQIAIILFTPLPTLIFSGMEHPLHAALTLTATFLAAHVLSSTEPSGGRKRYFWILALAPFLTAARFEGMFLVFVIAAGFLLRKQARRGILFGALGMLPIAAYAIVARLHGWPFLPTTVLLKSAFADAPSPAMFLLGLIQRALANLWTGSHLVTLVLVVIVIELATKNERRGRGWTVERAMTGILAGTAILHLGLARVGWFYRYEAYLVALGIVVTACRSSVLIEYLEGGEKLKPRGRSSAMAGATTLLLIATLFLCLFRGIRSLAELPQATVNIFHQQRQMAAFVSRYYQHSSVAVNDIGAVNFYSDIHCLDLWGLASRTVARLKVRREYGPRDIAHLTLESGTRVALVYDSTYEAMGGLPSEWIKAGEWRIHDNVVTGSDVVSIYAVDRGELDSLIANLAEFSRDLPPDVGQSGLYTRYIAQNP